MDFRTGANGTFPTTVTTTQTYYLEPFFLIDSGAKVAASGVGPDIRATGVVALTPNVSTVQVSGFSTAAVPTGAAPRTPGVATVNCLGSPASARGTGLGTATPGVAYVNVAGIDATSSTAQIIPGGIVPFAEVFVPGAVRVNMSLPTISRAFAYSPGGARASVYQGSGVNGSVYTPEARESEVFLK